MSLAGEKATQFANCEQFSSFYGVWITELKELGVEQIPMFELSLREYTLSLLFVASGLYKQAMASLRFSLEYTLFSIMLSSSELNYRLWKTHQKMNAGQKLYMPKQGYMVPFLFRLLLLN